VWCSEGNNEAMADDLAYLMLGMATDSYHIPLESGYACGLRHKFNTTLGEAWVSFGIGCPMQSASSEIYRLVEVNEDGTEKYP
jgi:hypothetical protein